MSVDHKWLYRACALILVGGGVVLGSPQAHATGLRCENKLVSTGDSTYEVRSLCGPPDDAQQRVERRSVRRLIDLPCGNRTPARCPVVVEDVVEVAVDEWTYDFGPQRFIQFLTFEQGKLVYIKSGPYGRKQL